LRISTVKEDIRAYKKGSNGKKMLHNEEINNLCSLLNREVADQIEETEMGTGR
jgi:hypothetical protein